jgi:hypothetical protein
MTQLGIPTEVTPQEVAREKSLGGAIDLCLKAAGLEPKEVQADLRLDKAQFSRWASGGEGIVWPKFAAVMDYCGNDAPLLWMVHDRGYDITSMRRTESELERQVRLLTEENTAIKRVLLGGAR